MPPPRPKRPAARPRLVVAPEPRGRAGAPEVPWDRNEETPIAEDPRALLGLEPAPAPPPASRGPRASAASAASPRPPPRPRTPSPRPATPPAAGAREEARADPSDQPAFLFVEKGPGAGQLVPVRQGTLVIGRGSSSDLRLVHPSISRKHAAVTREGRQFFIRDFGSQNGTFVNQLRCPQELELFPGDEIALGNAVIRLRSRADRDDAPRGRRGAAGAPRADARSSGSLRWMVLVAATSVGLVGALGWALLHQPETGPIMAPVPGGSAPDPGTRTAGTPRTSPESARPPAGAEAASPAVRTAPGAESGTGVQAPSGSRLAEPPPSAAVLADRGAATTTEASSPEEQVPRRAEPPVRPTASGPTSGPASTTKAKPPVTRKETRRRTRDSRDGASDASSAERTSGSSASAVRKVTPSPEPTPPTTRQSTPVTGPPPPAVLAAYEAGDVAGALRQARGAGQVELASRLERFQRAYEGGKQALVKKDGNGAIRQFVLAAKLDEGISKGWGAYGPELRSRLTRLYAAAGAQKARAGDSDGARKAYQAALRYDASNAEARAGLEALGGAR